MSSTIATRIKQARAYLRMTQKEVAEALGVTKQAVSGYETGRVQPTNEIQSLFTARGINPVWLLTGEGEMLLPGQSDGGHGGPPNIQRREEPAPGEADPMGDAMEVTWGGELIRPPRELSARIPVPVVEVAGGTGGVAAIEGHTLYVDYLTTDAFILRFGQLPPRTGSGARLRWCIALVRGESMVPRYYDREEVPIELFQEPLTDVAGGDVYLVRLDGHLYLKIIERRPAQGDAPPLVVLRSANPAYRETTVVLDGSVDFAILGRVIERDKDRLNFALIAKQLGL